MIQNEDHNRIRLYLLGKLADSEKERIEQELLGNEDLFEEILIVEEELADDYVAGKLGRAERTDFEKHFLVTPERQQNLRFAQALSRYVTAEVNRNPDVVPVTRNPDVVPVTPSFWKPKSSVGR